MNSIFRQFVAIPLWAACSYVLADAYVCQLPNKSRVIQSEPCSNSQVTLSSSQSGKQSIEEQNANAARARADLQRQTDFFYKQRAIEAAGRQPTSKRETVNDRLDDLEFDAIRANNEINRMRQQQNYERQYPSRR